MYIVFTKLTLCSFRSEITYTTSLNTKTSRVTKCITIMASRIPIYSVVPNENRCLIKPIEEMQLK